MTTVRTFTPKPADIQRVWYEVDADGAVLGRLATEVARVLRGKHKPIFAPHADTGDHVIVVNVSKLQMTAGKADKKRYYRHSGYPGGLSSRSYAELLANDPEDVPGLKSGSPVKVNEDELFDYIRHLADGGTEGNETGALMTKKQR